MFSRAVRRPRACHLATFSPRAASVVRYALARTSARPSAGESWSVTSASSRTDGRRALAADQVEHPAELPVRIPRGGFQLDRGDRLDLLRVVRVKPDAA